jgi:hypothetical protein
MLPVMAEDNAPDRLHELTDRLNDLVAENRALRERVVNAALLHVLNVYPPWGEPMHDPGLNLLALSYRIVYTIVGGDLTATHLALAKDTPISRPLSALGSLQKTGSVFR